MLLCPTFIDDDRAVVAHLDARFGQSEPAGVGRSSGGHQHDIGQRSRAIVDLHTQPGAAARDGHRLASEAQAHALLLHLGRDEVGDLGVEAAQQPLTTDQLRDLGTEAVEDRRHLARDVAAADDDQAARKLGQVEHLVRNHRVFAAGYAEVTRMTAGGHQDVTRADAPCSAAASELDAHCIGRLDDRIAAQQRGAGTVEQPLVDAVQARDLRRPTLLQPRPSRIARSTGFQP